MYQLDDKHSLPHPIAALRKEPSLVSALGDPNDAATTRLFRHGTMREPKHSQRLGDTRAMISAVQSG